MSLSPRASKRRIVFVAPQLTGESLRGARAVAQLDEVVLLGVCQQPANSEDARVFSGVLRVDDVHHAGQLIDAARRLAAKHGSLERIVTVHETLLEPVARAGEMLELAGLSVSTVRRALDKSLLKRVFQQQGIATARHRVVTSEQGATGFVNEVGFPIVLKPLGGSGGLATWRIHTSQELATALQLLKPRPQNPLFAEVFLSGQELCIDTITVGNQPRFYSLCCYRPTILEALEDPSIQWTCIMPRDIRDPLYRDFIEQGLAAVRALKVGDAMTHLEGFLLADGRVRFTDATLRPAGARIGPMLGFACDIDPYRAWARVAVDGACDGPWERKYAVGTIFLRGAGQGQVACVEGIQAIRQRLSELVVESRLPRAGNAKAVTYTGDGYITLRHPETQAVEEALDLIGKTMLIRYSDTDTSAASGTAPGRQWSQRLRHFERRLYQPAWDDDSLSRLSDA